MISPYQIVLSLMFLVGAIALSLWYRLNLEWNLIAAAGRTVLQLVVLGYLLAAIVAFQDPIWVGLMLILFLGVGTIVTSNRISQKIPQLGWIIGGSLGVSVGLTVVFAQLVILQPARWYEPQTLIPLFGIVLGNAMNGAAIAGEHFIRTIASHTGEIETHLSLGATSEQAIASYRREAMRAGILPTLNTMMIIGLGSLPSVMAGRMLGPADPPLDAYTVPLQAAAYQAIALLMMMFATLLANTLVIQGLGRRIFTRSGQLIRW